MRILCFVLAAFSCLQVDAWGFFGHQKINEIAIFTLPKPLFGFYKTHLTFIVEHAVDADKRRYIIEEEACRHYLDGDYYECSLPLDTLPQQYKNAIEIYSEDTVHKHGIVLWYVQTVFYRLTEAFKMKDKKLILKLSADLGHYIGDLHVPLHASSNYNGQKTGQKGIHALWESRLPELYFDNYDLFTGLATYRDSISTDCFKAYSASFALVDSVLKTEKQVTLLFDDDKKYSWETRGQLTVRVYSKEFCLVYHAALGNMVEDRMRASIVLLGSLWYSAWVKGGQPDLDHMPLPVENESDLLPSTDKMLGREED